MALSLDFLRDRKEAAMLVADRRLWQTADRSCLVEDGDPEAAFLFCTPGDEVPEEEARRYGLLKVKAEPPPEDKAVKAPPEDKAAEPMPEASVEVDPDSEIPGTVEEFEAAPKRIMEPKVRRQGKRRR